MLLVGDVWGSQVGKESAGSELMRSDPVKGYRRDKRSYKADDRHRLLHKCLDVDSWIEGEDAKHIGDAGLAAFPRALAADLDEMPHVAWVPMAHRQRFQFAYAEPVLSVAERYLASMLDYFADIATAKEAAAFEHAVASTQERHAHLGY